MAKNNKLIALFAFALLAVFMQMQFASADSLLSFSRDDLKCTIHGNFEFNSRVEASLKTSDITFVATPENGQPFEFNGKWYDETASADYFSEIYDSLEPGARYYFKTGDGLFDKGTYKINITTKRGVMLSSDLIEISCPQYVVSCDAIKLDVKECYREGSNFIVNFIGQGLEQGASKLDVYKDLLYEIDTKTNHWSYGELPKNLVIEKQEDSVYRMTFPVGSTISSNKENNTINSVRIKVKEDISITPFIGDGCSNVVYPNTIEEEIRCPFQMNKTTETEETETAAEPRARRNI